MAWWSPSRVARACRNDFRFGPFAHLNGKHSQRRANGNHRRRQVEALEPRLLLADGAAPPTPLVSDSELVAHWNFNEGTGTFAADTAPSGVDDTGTLEADADWSPFGSGGSIELDGSGDFVSVPNSIDLNLSVNARRTISAWFFAENVSIDSRKQVVYEEGGRSRGVNVYLHGGNLYVGGWNIPPSESGWAGTFLMSDQIASGRWHHVALVLDGSATLEPGAFEVFLDGASIGSGPGSQLWVRSGGIGIGAVNGFTKFHDGDTQGGEHGLAGSIDELRVYNRALTPEEVQTLAARTLVAPVGVAVQRIASGLSRPLYVTAPPGDSDRLFIVEQHSGRIKILDLRSGGVRGTPFLEINDLATGNEQGLLGLAFHPNYASNGFFYVNFTDATGTTNIRRYTVSAANPNVADPASAMTVLTYSQPQSSHNGGWLGFGPDGMLYIATGDGGGSDDNDAGHTEGTGNAQDITNNLLGKILRLDVDGDDFPANANRNYAIPPDNPFVGVTGDDEIWAYGLRNPWRPSFDRLTGDLYMADVGQSAREEVNFQPASSGGGENYGWRLREGLIATPTGGVGGPKPPGAVDPIYEYTHGAGSTQGRTVTGGYVYRGFIPDLQGLYFFADFLNERIWSLRHDGTTVTEFQDWTDRFVPDVGSIDLISSFGEDARGNLYVVDLGGEVFRVTSAFVSGADLVARWRFDEGTGNTAKDTASSGVVDDTATLVGDADWSPFGRNGAIRFDGAGDLVAVPDSVDINLATNSRRTVTAWVFVDDPSLDSRKQVVYEEGGVARGLNIYVHAGRLYVGGWNDVSGESGWQGTYLTTDEIRPGRWHHVGLVLNGTKSVGPGALTAYLDGALFATGLGSQLWQHGGDTGIGRINGFTRFHDGQTQGGEHGLAGLIDDVRVYNRALTAAEVQRIALAFLAAPEAAAAPSEPALARGDVLMPRTKDFQSFDPPALAQPSHGAPQRAAPEAIFAPRGDARESASFDRASSLDSIDQAMLEPTDDPWDSVIADLAEDLAEHIETPPAALPWLI